MSMSDAGSVVLLAIIVGFFGVPWLFYLGIDRLCRKDEERMPTVDILGEIAEHAQLNEVPRYYKQFDSSGAGGAVLTLRDREVDTFVRWAKSLADRLITGHVRDVVGMLQVSGYLRSGAALNVYVTLPAGAMHDGHLVGVVDLPVLEQFVADRVAVPA
ncbi:hypothetical protein GCM10027258_63070 [Amycolatopsis stemonae]